MYRTMLNVLFILIATLASLCLLLFVFQDRLIFHPRPNDQRLVREWLPHRVEIPAGNSTIEGWWAKNRDAPTAITVLYFGGNAEDVLYTATTAPLLEARQVLVTNYRGYGANTGRPGQDALFEDALAVYDYAVGQAQVDSQEIVLMGRSLGTGVATWIAANRPVRAAILVTPYDSILMVAQRHYGFAPVHWLLRHRFPSDELARCATVPALMIAGERDFIIPPAHATRLHEAWAGEKELYILKGAGHNNIEQHPDYYRLVNTFLHSQVSERKSN